MPSVDQKWEDFLNPEKLRESLISAALYIAAFESLKDSIVQNLRSFCCIGFSEDDSPCDDYKEKVLSLNKSAVYASLEWFKENGAIHQGDIDKFNEIKKVRNFLSHGLFKMLGGTSLPADFVAQFQALIELQYKIDHWWVVNIEIPTNPEFSDQEINEEEINPGSTIAMRLMLDIALGDEKTSKYYYEQFIAKKSG